MKRLVIWMIAFAIAATLLAWFAPTDVAAQDNVTSAVWGEVTGDGVRIRAGASQNYKILGVAKKGDRLVIIGEKNGWAQIQANGLFPCWISSKFVRRNGQAGTVSGNRVNLRLEPKAAHLPLGQADEGTVVRILEERSGWYRITPPTGVSVYIHSNYVRRGSGVTTAEFAAWMGGAPIAEEAEPVEVISAEELEAQKKKEQEQKTWDDLLARFDNALESAKSDKPTVEGLRLIETLAAEFAMFADVCETAEIAAAANQQSRVLEHTRKLMQDALNERDAARRRAAEVELARKAEEQRLAELERKRLAELERKEQEMVAARQNEKLDREKEILARLLYVAPEGYTASGKVVDVRDSRGRQTFLLEGEDGTTWELRLTPSTRHFNLARLWQRNIGVRGRIVTIEGERWPVLVCDEIDQQD